MGSSTIRSTSLLALLITVVSVVHGVSFQEMEISPSTIYLGDDATLTCKVVVGPGQSIDSANMIEWFKRVDDKGQGTPKEVAINNVVAEPFSTSGRYTASIGFEPADADPEDKSIERTVVTTLTITGVTAQDSGIIGCKLPPKAGVGHVTIDKPFNVISNVSAVTLKVIKDDTEVVAETVDQNITFTEGEKRKLYCEVTGGYPEPQVQVFLDNKDITNMFVKTSELKQEGAKEGLKALSYDVSLKNESFTFNYEYSRKKIECKSSIPASTRPTETKKSFTVALSGFTPKFDCKDSYDVKMNQANFEVVCSVIAEPIAKDFKVEWQAGPNHNQNTSIVSDGQRKGDYTLRFEDGKPGVVNMILHIDRVYIQHFTKYFFEATNEQGTTTHELSLINADDNGARCSRPGFLLVLLLAAMLIFLS